jgi:hypothetical protein
MRRRGRPGDRHQSARRVFRSVRAGLGLTHLGLTHLDLTHLDQLGPEPYLQPPKTQRSSVSPFAAP